MMVHSLQDSHVLYDGGCGPDCRLEGETAFASFSDTLTRWVEANRCASAPNRYLENEKAYCDRYTGCQNGVEVVACVTQDGGHSWPGITETSNPLEKNKPSTAINATDEIWDFFESKT